ncbi:autotransporter outer membrane beta-barrel domain-containing protein [Acinetobacter equi]|uniref:Autotransporter domain-containing protein n=1 Tax=Acinetobacter equi TaxID=1324350 RepID=A0A0N9W102_9GAMM|nr:autotransporter outer membrane beta-barrel domain-containing protein [Acinetobacter equi]ALH96282.1 hypothetical protein AOY20_12455 [Acinetobacter equi]
MNKFPLNKLTMALLMVTTAQYTQAASDNIKYKNYDSNNNIGGCTVVNIQYESTMIKDSNGNDVLRYPEGTPNSQREGNSTGRFDVFSNSGQICDVEDFLNQELTGGDLKYTQQRDDYIYGHIDIKEGVFTATSATEKAVTAETTAEKMYLVLMSDRPSTASFKIEANSTADIKRNFMVINTLGGHGLQNVGGKLKVAGSLVTDARSGRDVTYPNYNPRSLYASNAIIEVDQDFSSYIRDDPKRTISGGSNADIISTKMDVGRNAYFYTNSGKSGVRMSGSSIFDIKGDLTLLSERLANITAKGDTNSYEAAVFTNTDSHLNVGGHTSITSQGFRGYVQNGNTAEFQTQNLIIDTTLEDATSDAKNVSAQALIISGGTIVSSGEISSLRSNGAALTVTGQKVAVTLGEGKENIELVDGKALVKLGENAKVESLLDHAIVINNVDGDIELQKGAIIKAGEGKSLLYDGSGNTTVHLYEDVDLTGDILLNTGEDTVNVQGNVDFTAVKIDAGSKIGEATIEEYDVLNLHGSTHKALDASKFLNFEDIYLKENSHISLLNHIGATLIASKDQEHGIFIDNTSSLKTQGAYILDANVTNSGILDITNEQFLPNISHISGGYHGNDGTLVINTRLGDDYSDTDKLIIQNEATGTTKLQVKNIGGGGAKTVQGIHVIQTGLSESNRTFYLEGGYVSAGVYDYSLNLKKANTSLNSTEFDNWYLESKVQQIDPPVDPLVPEQPIYTPDVGTYSAAKAMANSLFTSRLEDREGASRYQNLEQDQGNVWIRTYGGHHKFKSMSDQLKTKGNSFVTQIGMGLVTLGVDNQYNLGVMGGYAHYSGKTRSYLTERNSKLIVDGYSAGLYGTWYAHPVEKRGVYIDSWVLWNSFKNKVDSADQNYYKYDSSGVTASIEAGGDYLLNKNGQKNWWIQPQGQFVYQNVKAETFYDQQGSHIDRGSDNLQVRLGFKTYLEIPTDVGKLTTYRPYIALNYIHNTNPYEIEVNGIKYGDEGSNDLGEVKLGVEGQITQNSQVWINASYIVGSQSTQSYQGNLGWKYNF